jgi:glycosyltransferase involved in cell wall biosynthesis
MAQDYPGLVEIILVDNGDNAGLDRLPAEVHVVSEAKPGSYAARNAGIAASTGAVLAFTDADCRPVRTWLSSGVDALGPNHRSAFAGGRVHVVPADGDSATTAELWDIVNHLNQEAYVIDQGWAATANLFVPRAVIETVGPFDRRLRSGGDREWGLRANEHGVLGLYAAEAVVLHPARRSTPELLSKIRRVTKGSIDVARLRGESSPQEVNLRAVLPHSRSILRRSRRVRSLGWSRSDQVRYVLLDHLVQYFRLYAAYRHNLSIKRPGP